MAATVAVNATVIGSGKLKTAEGRIDYAVPQVRGLDGWKSAVRDALTGRTEELERLAIEM